MAAPRINDEQQRVLWFWRMLELCSPQRVPKVTQHITRPEDRRVIRWLPSDPPPWKRLKHPKPLNGKSRVWQHTVYLGVYELEAIYDWLHHAFADDKDAYDERRGGLSACAGLLIDQQGQLVPESTVLSSALWAVARIMYPGPQDPSWTRGFTAAQQAFNEAVVRYENDHISQDSNEPLIHDARTISDLLHIAHDVSGISGARRLATDQVIVESKVIFTERAREEPDIDFLNSFYLDDLTTVLNHASSQEGIGSALATYLTADHLLDTRSRVDVLKNPEVVDTSVSIDRLPKGRWPSNPEHGLALSQQFAVNEILHGLTDTNGLMGVNGPPGTGKTTMLRDILAGNVVERARRLAKIENPRHAFRNNTYEWNTSDGHTRRVRQLRAELTGFEMVVASANNAAVENVTTEIPAQDAIDSRWWQDADYFGDIATAVFQTKTADGKAVDGFRAWGIIAARLGKKRYRQAFRSAFWFDTRERNADGSPVDGILRMQSWLKQWIDGSKTPKNWTQARQEFRRAESRVDTLIDTRRQAQQRLNELREMIRSEKALSAMTEQAGTELYAAQREAADHKAKEEDTQTRLALLSAQHDRHLATKPGVLEIIFTLGRAIRTWRNTMDIISEELRGVELDSHRVAAHGQRLYQQVVQRGIALDDLRDELARTRDTLAKLRASCAQDKQHYGVGYPDEEWDSSRENRELHTPWLDPELDMARSELFLAALRLHRDFFANTALDMLAGLRAACDVIAGNYPPALEPEKLRAAWQIFFLVVPMVSTTFASFGRMFSGIGPEAIGWLLIDEAGQASPQYAVGAIWRSQRVVAVGDPLQLQPIVTIPQKAQRDIAITMGISSTWIPPQASVQTLADRVSRHGTTLQQGENLTWVSIPLLVHRRCDNPMFELCNEIAYNGIMVNGVPPRTSSSAGFDLFDGPDGPVIKQSCWFDEPALTPGSHLQENQIDRLQKELSYLEANGIAASDIIAISPFRAVADRLTNLAGKYRDLQAGTIHTAQGREAPVVFLVLGGDPNSPGAKAWASATVNLVNVAVSRARRRLYVIGDLDSWAPYNYFHELAMTLSPKRT